MNANKKTNIKAFYKKVTQSRQRLQNRITGILEACN